MTRPWMPIRAVISPLFVVAVARGAGDGRLKTQIVADRLLAGRGHLIGGGSGANVDRGAEQVAWRLIRRARAGPSAGASSDLPPNRLLKRSVIDCADAGEASMPAPMANEIATTAYYFFFPFAFGSGFRACGSKPM